MMDRERALSRQRFRGRIVAGAVLAVAMWFSVFQQSALGLLAPFIMNDVGLSSTQLGLLATLVYGAGAFGSLAAGHITDRYDSGKLLSGVFVLALAGIALMATAPTVAWLAIAVLIGGSANSLGNPVTNDIIISRNGWSSHGELLGIKQAGVKAGTFINGLFLPGLAVLIGWRYALAGWMLIPVAGLIIGRRIYPYHGVERGEVERVHGAAVPKSMRRLSIYGFFMGAGSASVLIYLPLYAVEVLDMTPTGAGILLSTTGLVSMMIRIVYGKLMERVRILPSHALVLLAIGAAASQLLFLLSSFSFAWLVWVGVLGYGLTAGGWNTWVHFAIIRGARDGATGRATAVVQLGFYLGLMASPYLFGYLIDASGSYTLSWLLVSALPLAAGVVAFGSGARGMGVGRTQLEA